MKSWTRVLCPSGLVRLVVLAALLALFQSSAAAQEKAATPTRAASTETVISTFRVKAGKEVEFAKVLARHWPTLRRLGLVLEKPHLVLRGVEDSGKTYFVEILTWRDHDAPDNVPPEVQAIWDQFQSLVERRDGHRGIEFPEVEVVELEKPTR